MFRKVGELMDASNVLLQVLLIRFVFMDILSSGYWAWADRNQKHSDAFGLQMARVQAVSCTIGTPS